MQELPIKSNIDLTMSPYLLLLPVPSHMNEAKTIRTNVIISNQLISK